MGAARGVWFPSLGLVGIFGRVWLIASNQAFPAIPFYVLLNIRELPTFQLQQCHRRDPVLSRLRCDIAVCVALEDTARGWIPHFVFIVPLGTVLI